MATVTTFYTVAATGVRACDGLTFHSAEDGSSVAAIVKFAAVHWF